MLELERVGIECLELLLGVGFPWDMRSHGESCYSMAEDEDVKWENIGMQGDEVASSLKR